MDPEHLRELAAGRLREQRRIDAAARLSDAQRMIASEHGFPSWPRMKAYADRIAAHPGGVQLAYHADLDYTQSAPTGRAHPPSTQRRAPSRRFGASGPRSPRMVRDWSSRGRTASRAGRRCGATSGGCRAAVSRSSAPTVPSRRTIPTACVRCSSAGPRSRGRRAPTATTCSPWRRPPVTTGRCTCCWSTTPSSALPPPPPAAPARRPRRPAGARAASGRRPGAPCRRGPQRRPPSSASPLRSRTEEFRRQAAVA